MQKQKKLTLQEYIQCHNIQKQLQERSKSKSKNKSPNKSQTKINNTFNKNQISLNDEQNPKQNSTNKVKIHQMNHQELSKTIYSQIDFRARNLYQAIQYQINDIKLQVRQFIRNDKNYAQFLRMMDGLMQKFRQGVMHIHRQNLILFQLSEQDLTRILSQNPNQTVLNTSKQDLAKTVLQKSFDDRWLQSKNQYQTNLNFMANKTIKQRMKDTRKGQDLVKTIFGGFLNESSSGQKAQTMIPKKYDTQPQNEEQRVRRKQQASSFLGYIMKNIARQKQLEKQLEKNASQTIKNSPKKIDQQKEQTNLIINNPVQNKNSHKKPIQIKNSKTTQVYSIKRLPIDVNNLKGNRLQSEKLVNNINYLNSSGKVNINTQQIDNYFDQHNMSFGLDKKKASKQKQNININSESKQKKPISPQKSQKNQYTHKVSINQKNIQQRNSRITNMIKNSKQKQKQRLSKNKPGSPNSKQQKIAQQAKSPQLTNIVSKSPQNLTSSKPLIRRTTNSKSKGKPSVGFTNNIQKDKYFQRK